MLPVALTSGEPAGIGGEITLKAWLARGGEALPPFFVIDDPERLSRLASSLGLDVPVAAIGSPAETADRFRDAMPVLSMPQPYRAQPGRPDLADAPQVIGAIERAVRFCLDGAAAAMVTNPISKADLYAAGFRHPGHTEFVAELSGGARSVMMLAGPKLRVVPATVHCALAEAASRLSTPDLVEIGTITAEALKRDFGLTDPVIAVAGLNPHAGEGGAMGTEDRDIIAPAVKEMQRAGIRATGPLPADTMFHEAARAGYDTALCMYHDQALIPVKTLDFDRTVNVTLGLPIIRTSPDHGTAYDIAGRGVARPESLIEAIRLAGEMAVRRAA